MRFFTIALIPFFLMGCQKIAEVSPQQKPGREQVAETQYGKELDEIKKSLKGEVKIKLKKDGKGGYSWEISGKDAQEVLKANDVLRKKLSD
jgi:hypothetical protein